MFDLGQFLPKALVSMVGLLPIVMGLVTWLGNATGINGRWQQVASMLCGLVLGVPVMYFQTEPSTAGGWFAVALFGLLVGLAASGAYEVQKASAEKAVEVHVEKVEEQAVMGGAASLAVDDQEIN